VPHFINSVTDFLGPSSEVQVPGATDLSVLRSVFGASSGCGTDLAGPGQWHPRHDLCHLLHFATKCENY